MKSQQDLQHIDIEKMLKSAEKDAGHPIPSMCTSLKEASAGQFAAVHTPETITARKRGRPVGSTKADAKRSTTIRFDPDVLAALKSTGPGWQTRANDILREKLLKTTV